MRWMKWGLLAALLTVLLAGGGMLSAQETPTAPIFDTLGAIPDAEFSREITTLVDRAAITRAYPGAVPPVDLDTFLAAWRSQSSATDGERLWTRVFRGLMDETSRNITDAQGLPNALGIEFMQIEQVVTFGVPPAHGMILAGAFETAAVESALSVRDYQFTDDLWCYQGDCSNGTMINFDLVDPSNPFGANIGRSQPILVADGVLASAPSEVIINALRDTAGEGETLASLPAYQAAASAISTLGTVIQATFVDGESLVNSSVSSNVPNMMLPDGDGIAPIAPYTLYAFADVVSGGEQIGAAAFVYEDANAALDALKQMTFRLETLESVSMPRLWRDILADRGLTVTADVIEVDGLTVALLLFSTPLATDAQILEATAENPGEAALPGEAYRLLYRMLSQRDDQWRWWE